MSGDAKHATRALQEWLRSQGHNVRVDGVMGPRTRAAVSVDTSPLTAQISTAVEKMTPKVIARAPIARDPKLVEAVRAECAKWGVAAEPTFRVVEHESGWNPSARSATGAVGLFQLTRWPIAQYNIDSGERRVADEDRYDVAVNIRVGVWYLRYCATMMGVDPSSTNTSDWARIYGAYNLGPAAMKAIIGGNYNAKIVQDAWRVQSEHLKQGGVERYVSNAEALFA